VVSSTTGWGFFEQGSDQQQEVMELGARLSIEIDCPVHYPAFGKHIYECHCRVLFPVFFVKANSWDIIRQKHNEGFKPEESD